MFFIMIHKFENCNLENIEFFIREWFCSVQPSLFPFCHSGENENPGDTKSSNHLGKVLGVR
jgi:hypothetical protein